MNEKIIKILLFVVIAGVVLYVFQAGLFDGVFSLGGDNSTSTDKSTDKRINPDDFVPKSWDEFVAKQRQGVTTSSTRSTIKPPSPPVSTGSGGGTSLPDIKPAEVPDGFTLGQISPFWGKIRVSSISPGSEKTYSRISLAVSLKKEESVNIGSWSLKSKKDSQPIPGAVSVRDPYGYNTPAPIVLKSGETINIYSTKSPAGNFRLNKCTGYLETLFDFIPPLPQSCPRAHDEVDSLYVYTSKCQDYIRSLGSCKLPETNFLWLTGDQACRDFLNTINYRGCFDRHQNDPDFLGREWRVWLDRRFLLDERHDRVLLFDREDKLVDEYIY